MNSVNVILSLLVDTLMLILNLQASSNEKDKRLFRERQQMLMIQKDAKRYAVFQ